MTISDRQIQDAPGPPGPPTQATPKRIILLLDGTWNDSQFGPFDSNIVRLRQAIAKTLRTRGSSGIALEGAPENAEKVAPSVTDAKANIVMYERGVGTGAFLDRFFGGAFGHGLTDNIRRAYKFLSFHYQPGDQVFIFGFSRGAYTARSLVGYIHSAGLLRRDQCTQELEQEAWDFYRAAPGDRLPGVWSKLGDHVHDRSKLRISLLGVFDTVGALGIPASFFQVANRDRYEFHDVELSSITDVNLHALAIDEHRAAFEAAVWRKSKFKNFDTKTEQVWFSGAHSDIGGGYVEEDTGSDRTESLDDLPFDWMVKRIKSHFSDFPIDASGWTELSSTEIRARCRAPLHEARRGLFKMLPFAFRSIANTRVSVGVGRKIWPRVRVVSRDRHADVIEESVHVSALLRALSEPRLAYHAPNLSSVLEMLRREFGKQTPAVGIVGWDGEPLKSNSVEALLLRDFLTGTETQR